MEMKPGYQQTEVGFIPEAGGFTPISRWLRSNATTSPETGKMKPGYQQAEVGVIPEPGGFRAISRGLSAATPPEIGRDKSRIPEGCQHGLRSLRDRMIRATTFRGWRSRATPG